MKICKDLLKSIKPFGFTWVCFDSGIHYFQKKEANGFYQLACTEKQVINGDLEYMAENGLTLGPKNIKKVQKAYRAKQKTNVSLA